MESVLSPFACDNLGLVQLWIQPHSPSLAVFLHLPHISRYTPFSTSVHSIYISILLVPRLRLASSVITRKQHQQLDRLKSSNLRGWE